MIGSKPILGLVILIISAAAAAARADTPLVVTSPDQGLAVTFDLPVPPR